MDFQLLALCGVMFITHLIGSLAYAVRIAGVRTRRIALSLALFSGLVLISRTASSFQGPFLAKRIESSIRGDLTNHLESDFRWLLIAATLASVLGTVLVPTAQRLFSLTIVHFQIHRSVARLALGLITRRGVSQFRDAIRFPSTVHIKNIHLTSGLPASVFVMNVITQALGTVGVLASLYAGSLNPTYRVTASSLAVVINGVATVLLFVFIDPHLSAYTDDVVEGKATEAGFRRAVVLLATARIAGTLLAQAIFVPAAMLVALLASHI